MGRRHLKAKNNDLIVIKRELISPINAEYFREDIRKYLYNTYGEKFLYEEGLVVKTTLDTLYQNLADEALINGLMKYDKRHGWRGSIINIAHNVTRKYECKLLNYS